MLGESHGRMLAHLRPMHFFDPALLPERVTYISAYQAVDDDGLKGLATLIRREIQARGATLLMLDGMGAVAAKAGDGFRSGSPMSCRRWPRQPTARFFC